METKKEIKILVWIAVVFGVAFFLPLDSPRFTTAIDATFDLVKWYAREHVVLCLLPAFFIAGVISIFLILSIYFWIKSPGKAQLINDKKGNPIPGSISTIEKVKIGLKFFENWP